MKSNILKLPKWLAYPFLLKSTSILVSTSRQPTNDKKRFKIHHAIIFYLTFVLILTLAWLTLPYLITSLDRYAGLLDPAVLQLLLLACIAFVCMLGLSALLFKWLFSLIGLPSIQTMVSQFKNLQLWQQFVCYWASFALLLLGALLSLVAIF
ncbi:MAG: hypothetical protein EOP54_20515 [Sphingobacteriales bacterium]|nr:MAG: hypothetical protein EOP54_20515 [Sphingobacteriales bacterium]